MRLAGSTGGDTKRIFWCLVGPSCSSSIVNCPLINMSSHNKIEIISIKYHKYSVGMPVLTHECFISLILKLTLYDDTFAQLMLYFFRLKYLSLKYIDTTVKIG